VVRHRESVRRKAPAGRHACRNFVIPAKAGIRFSSLDRRIAKKRKELDPGLRRDDEGERVLRRRISLRPRRDRRRGYGAARKKFLKSPGASG
jgi:hypothetical protein